MTLFLKPSSSVEKYYVNHTAAYTGDSGIDLFFPSDISCKPKSNTMIDLGVCCKMEVNGKASSYYVYPRSSISKTPLLMANSVGIIDSGYRNTIKVVVYNTSDLVFDIKTGTKLFQICEPGLKELKIEMVDSLDSTDRGEGFGSSNR